MPPERKLQERMERSRPIVESFFNELANRSLAPQNPPRNKLKDAIDYALKRREQLSSWLGTPCIPIDNNQVERAIRPVTVGRKNSLFIGSPEAGQPSSIRWWRNANAPEQTFNAGWQKCCAVCQRTEQPKGTCP